MAGEWVEKSLGDLVDIKHGFAFEGKYFRDEPPGDVLLTPGNFAVGGGFKADKFRYYHGPIPEEFVLHSGDLLITMTDLSKNADTLGYPAIVPVTTGHRRYLHNQRLGKVLAKERVPVDLRYVHYLLCSQRYRDEIVASATGTTVKHTSPERIKRFRFLLPPSMEQRAIAHILGTLDDKIELNRRMNETLEAIARAIFRSWFIDFDPIRAKASGEAPESICHRLGLTPDLLELFPNQLDGSEIGEIPQGWNVEPVDALAEAIFSGGTPDTRKPEYWDGEQSWFSSGETRNRFVIGTEKKITAEGVEASSTRAARPGDILIASAGQGLTRGQTSYCAMDTYINQSVVCVRPNTPRTHPLWLFYDLSGRYEEMRAISDSHSSRGSLTTKLIGSIRVCYPGETLSHYFGVTTQSLVNAQIGNLQQVGLLTSIRDALLPKLLSGELRVPEAVANERS